MTVQVESCWNSLDDFAACKLLVVLLASYPYLTNDGPKIVLLKFRDTPPNPKSKYYIPG